MGFCFPGSVHLTKKKAVKYPYGNQARKELVLKNNELIVSVSDNCTVNCDIITILLNDRIVVDHYSVVKEAKIIKIKIDGEIEQYELVFRAENEGATPPNTALVVVQNGKTTKKFHMKADLETNDVVYLILKSKNK